MSSKYVVLDTFSGAGGLTEGFFRNNFEIVGHIEMDQYAVKTLETRSLFYKLKEIKKDSIYFDYYLGKISREEFISQCDRYSLTDIGCFNQEITNENENLIIKNIQDRLDKNDLKKIDVIIGGPPCQAYSYAGRGRDPNGMKFDPRNNLYLHYLKFLKKFSPAIFVFENVPGITTAKDGFIFRDFISKIKELGYSIPAKPPIINSSNFGVLQNRKRIIYIGWKGRHDLSYPTFEPYLKKYSIWDLLRDLPSLEPGQGTDGPQSYSSVPLSKYLEESKIRSDEQYVRHHIARPHTEQDRTIYRIAIKKWNDQHKRLNYNELPEELKTHSNRSSFLDRFKVLNGNGLSHAIVAHISKDGHNYIHPDLSQARSITVREAARIQSFPDNYLFEGPRTSQFKQIGNAVPPLMAEGIATEIKNMLNSL